MAAAGIIGGRRPGAGRPRRDRFSRMVAEGLAEHVDEVIEALRRGMASTNERTAVMAARAASDLLVRSDALQQRTEEHAVDGYSRMSEDEVRAEFAEVLIEAIATGEIPAAEVLALAPADSADSA